MGDWLADQLAAEEHRQGRRYGEDAGHCEACHEAYKTELLRRVMESCEHRHMIRLSRLDSALIPGICADCGHQVDDVRVG